MCIRDRCIVRYIDRIEYTTVSWRYQLVYMPFTEIPHLKLCRIKHLVKICIYMVAAGFAYVDELYHSCGRLIADYEIRLVAMLLSLIHI